MFRPWTCTHAPTPLSWELILDPRLCDTPPIRRGGEDAPRSFHCVGVNIDGLHLFRRWVETRQDHSDWRFGEPINPDQVSYSGEGSGGPGSPRQARLRWTVPGIERVRNSGSGVDAVRGWRGRDRCGDVGGLLGEDSGGHREFERLLRLEKWEMKVREPFVPVPGTNLPFDFRSAFNH